MKKEIKTNIILILFVIFVILQLILSVGIGYMINLNII